MASAKPMNDQMYNARFESMKRHSTGSSSGSENRQIIVVHKELDRQCQSIVARHRSDTRIVTSELRRERQSLESRRDRLERERERTRRDDARNRRYLADTERRHSMLEQRVAAAEGRLPERIKSASEKRDAARNEAENLMRSVNRMVLPVETKQRLRDEIAIMYGYLYE